MAIPKPEKILGDISSGSTRGIHIDKIPQPKPEPGKSFESYMGKQGEGSQTSGQAGKISPFDLANQGISQLHPTRESLLAQIHSASSVLGDLQQEFHTKNLKLKKHQTKRLRKKLANANRAIREGGNKMGGKMPHHTPFTKLIDFMTDSQAKLHKVNGMVEKLGSKGTALNPGTLLKVQVKIAEAQRELEFASILLSKAVDAVKQMFNIQI